MGKGRACRLWLWLFCSTAFLTWPINKGHHLLLNSLHPLMDGGGARLRLAENLTGLWQCWATVIVRMDTASKDRETDINGIDCLGFHRARNEKHHSGHSAWPSLSGKCSHVPRCVSQVSCSLLSNSHISKTRKMEILLLGLVSKLF